MGICSSCEATSVATAKLILYDGKLQEYPYPVKVSYVLQQNPTYFICNSDEMDFNDVVSAVSDEEELQPGQLYFALPLSRLKHRLQAEEMAALAVKASSALAKNGCSENQLKPPSRKVADGHSGDTESRMRRSGSGGGGRRGKYEAMLSAIPE
ncbi:unnamed protein product [Fraxinus pennsylvanica]|uniref:Uncharacterized protein n=1 Tax=Fraxinus pennsylvanica TaxID=56036 RepID=A0AAD1Z5G8_9LAMI|nr:unnamed protein product [Fraxinus pennsylvanica]